MKARFVGLFAILLFALSALPASSMSPVVADKGWIINDGSTIVVPVTFTCEADANLVHAAVEIMQPSGRLMAWGQGFTEGSGCLSGQETTLVIEARARAGHFKSGPATATVSVSAYSDGLWVDGYAASGTIKLRK